MFWCSSLQYLVSTRGMPPMSAHSVQALDLHSSHTWHHSHISGAGTTLLPPIRSEDTETQRDRIIGAELIIVTFQFGSPQTNPEVCLATALCCHWEQVSFFVKNPSKSSVLSFLWCTWLVGSSVFPQKNRMMHYCTRSESLPSALFYTLRVPRLTPSLCSTAHIDAQLLEVSRPLIL